MPAADKHLGLRSLLHSRAGFWLVFLFLMLGDFLSIAQIAPTINYNYLNSSLVYITAGLLFAFAAFRADGAGSSRLAVLPWLAGCMMGLDFFVKFTSSVQMLGAGILFLLLMLPAIPWKRRLAPVLIFGLGYLCGLGFYFLLFQDFSSWYAGFLDNVRAQTGGTHSPLRIISKQANDFVRIGKALLTHTIVPVVLGFAVIRLHGRWPNAWLLVPILVVAELALSLLEYRPHNLRLNTLLYASILLTLGTMYLATYPRPESQENKLYPGKVLAVLFLVMLPLLLVFGSDSSFSYSIPLYLLPWFGAILAILLWFPLNRPALAALLAVAVVAQFEFVVGYLYHPWRLVRNRVAQTEPVPGVRELAKIRVDLPTYQFIMESQKLAAAAQDASPVMLAVYEMPGVVYWLNGYPPGLPWFSHSKREQATACRSLRQKTDKVFPADLKRALILVQDEPLPEFAACLRAEGIDLASYRKLGETVNPYSNKAVVFYAPPVKEMP